MKVATYNIHFGGKKGSGNAWQGLLTAHDLDLIMAQETFHPSEYFSKTDFAKFRGCLWMHVPDGKWGSAIVSRNHEIQEVQIPEFSGWVVAGRIPDLMIGSRSHDVLVVSVHAPSPGPYEPSVRRILDAIAAIRGTSKLLIGGDFNITTAFRHPADELPLKNTTGEIKLLERMRREFGLVNAWQTAHPNRSLPQTLRWSKD